VIIFIKEDEAYLHWIDQNRAGFVVNAQRRPTPAYLILHRATCSQIATATRTNWTTKQYIKICSEDLDQLKAWAQCEVGGELRPCGFCCKELKPSAPPVLTLEPASITPRAGDAEAWRFWRAKRELAAFKDIVPLKASWEKSTDPSQVRLRDYRQRVRESVISALSHDCLYLNLRVGLPHTINLLNGNDLENYLTPLFECGCLPASQFRLVTAEKSSGDSSVLTVGVAEVSDSNTEMSDYCNFSICPTTTPANDRLFKEELHSAVAACGQSALPDGEVELHVAWRCALGRRSWFRLWKSTGDALGPILGAYKRKNQFDPRDDRITKLVFQFLPDESVGDRLQIGMWWRMR
jgi:hypothetical protein